MTSPDQPGTPRSAKPGALRLVLDSAAFPNPPIPPSATTSSMPASSRSAITSPLDFLTIVPIGTGSFRSSP